MTLYRSPLSLSLAIGLILIVSTCRADSDVAEYERYAEAQRTNAVAEIPRLVRKYGETIGCNFAMKESNIVPYTQGNSRSFVALFSIDEGCSGGSAMSRPVLAMLRWGGSGLWDLFIDPNYSLPKQSTSLPQTVTKIYAVGRELRFEALVSQPSDTLCCPSKKVSGRIILTSKGWVAQ